MVSTVFLNVLFREIKLTNTNRLEGTTMRCLKVEVRFVIPNEY